MSSRPLAVTRCWLLLLLLAVVAGCTLDRSEPGLFERVEPAPSEPNTEPPPPPGNPDLPVVGEATWTSGEGLDITVRLAVHAVRRIEGGTVLDWSVTPLSAPGLRAGDALPASFNLALTRFGEQNVNIFLIDARAQRVYRPLTRDAPGVPECLCTTTSAVQLGLRLHQTILLQVVYPPLPEAIRTVDVDIATVPVFSAVPVTPEGQIPLPNAPTELTRPGDRPVPAAASAVFSHGRSNQRFKIIIDSVQAGRSFTSISWTITALDQGPGLETVRTAPFAEEDPPLRPYNLTAASGPQLLLHLARSPSLQAQLMSTGQAGSECLCTDLRTWTTALRQAGGQVSVVTNLPAVPLGFSAVHVVLPGVGILRDVPLTRASDSSLRSAGPTAYEPRFWSFRPGRPHPGWTGEGWPTPVPDPDDMPDFVATVSEIIR